MIPYTKLRSQPRLDLAAASPLPAPLTIYVEPTNVCNFKCTMCPESLPDYGERAGYYGQMDMTTFDKVLFQIREFGLIKTLKLYDEGEPLLHRDICTMILKAKEVAERVEVTTNASLLTPATAWGLVSSGLTYLRVSIYGMGGAHADATGQRRFRPEDIWKNVATLRALRDKTGKQMPFIHAQLLPSCPEDVPEFHKWYDGVADDTRVEKLHNWGSTLLVNIAPSPGAHATKKCCPAPFYTLTIKANGDVTVCCVDWAGKLKLGNVTTSTLKQMWEGQMLKQLRLTHLQGLRHSYGVCRDCTYVETMPDSLDHLTAEAFDARA